MFLPSYISDMEEQVIQIEIYLLCSSYFPFIPMVALLNLEVLPLVSLGV